MSLEIITDIIEFIKLFGTEFYVEENDIVCVTKIFVNYFMVNRFVSDVSLEKIMM